jgi:hypothetical protein
MCNEEFHDLYSPYIIRLAKPRTRQTWTVWDTGEVHTGFWWGKLTERATPEDLGVDRKII